jgi:hypothetical protein
MLTNLIISAVSGAVGGNAMGGIVKKLNLGSLGNTLAGALGGAGAGEALAIFMPPDGAAPLAGMADAASGGGLTGILTTIVVGGAGGGVLTGMIAKAKKMRKNMMGGGE